MKKALRVCKNQEFDRIIKLRQSCANGTFVLYCARKRFAYCRAGISVSKKLGNAVERNRIKRQVREIIGANYDFINDPYDIILIVRVNFLKQDFLDNSKDFQKLIKKAIINKYEN